MKNKTAIVIGLLITKLLFYSCKPNEVHEEPDWNNPKIYFRNVEPQGAECVSFPDVETALLYKNEKSPYYITLNGFWKFKFSESPKKRTEFFYINEFSDLSWDDIEVPSCWQMKGYGTLMYNMGKEKDTDAVLDFPHINKEKNEVGAYRRYFTLPDSWDGRQIFLHFDGVQSAFYLWVNGIKAGYSERGRTAAEFNITKYVKTGSNLIAVEVYRYSDASFLETDEWHMSGIYRDVYLYSAPETRIRDMYLYSELYESNENVKLNVKVSISNFSDVPLKTPVVEVLLYDKQLKPLAGTTSMQGIYKDSDGSPASIVKRTEGVIEMNSIIKNPELWSAENPVLYLAVIILKDIDGNILDIVKTRFGFRKAEIRNEELYINNTVVEKNMVYYKMFDPYTGMSLSKKRMEEDIQLMKQNNINTVCLLHYPCNNSWYELCDKYGIYVIDETYIEKTLLNDTHWSHFIKVRFSYMVLQNRNHPCVAAWSAGSKMFEEANMKTILEIVKRYDPSRNVYFERDIQDVSKFGNMLWAASSIIKKDSEGREYYSGPFARTVVLPNRQPAPISYELKKNYQELKIVPASLSDKCIRIINMNELSTSLPFKVVWSVTEDGKKEQEGETKKYILKPGQGMNIYLQMEYPKIEDGAEYHLNIKCLLEEDKIWAKKGHVVASEQFLLPFNRSEKSVADYSKYDELNTVETKGEIKVIGDNFSVVFSKYSGTIRSLIYENEEMISATAGPVFYEFRNLENKDSLNLDDSFIGIGKVGRKCESISISQVSATSVSLDVKNVISQKKIPIVEHYSTWTVYADGSIVMENTFKPAQENKEMPAAGIRFFAAAGLENCEWYGRGPNENDETNKSSAYIGRYKMKVDDMFMSSAKPFMNGNREDIRWLKLTADNGKGIIVKPEIPLPFMVLRYTIEEIESADYVKDLRKRSDIVLYIGSCDNRNFKLSIMPVFRYNQDR